MMIIPCECGAKLKLNEAKISGNAVKVRCPRCGNVVPVRGRSTTRPAPVVKDASPPVLSGGHLVLVAHDSDVLRTMICDVLTQSGFRVDKAADGFEVMSKATKNIPQGLVLDVGLPGIYGFEICERLKGSPKTSAIKIVLLSSVYDMRRYKRKPVNLYGADDYIEKHHIPDALATKLQRLIAPVRDAHETQNEKEHVGQTLPERTRPPAREFDPSLFGADVAEYSGHASAKPAPSRYPARKEPSDRTVHMPEPLSLEPALFLKEELDIPKASPVDPEGIEKARRFSRIIVSDIALYNQEAMIEGIKNGTLYELLKNDVDEGRELYEQRVPAAIKAQKDFYQEAFNNFIASVRKQIAQEDCSLT